MKELLSKIYDKLDEKQAEDIVLLDVRGITPIADYFVIASADNERKVKSMANELDDFIEKNGLPLRSKEGMDTSRWILLDYGDIIVHLFQEEERDFYNIEKIWKDGINITPN